MTVEDIKKIVAETLNCEIEEVKEDSSLADDLGADSLAAVELNMALEEQFGSCIPFEELENVKTVQDIINYLVK